VRRLILHGDRGRREEGVNCTEVATTLLGMGKDSATNELQKNKLEELAKGQGSVELAVEVLEGFVTIDREERHKGIALADDVIALRRREQLVQELASIGQQVRILVVDGVQSHDGLALHVHVPMAEILTNALEQRHQKVRIAQRAEEAETSAADIFVGVIEVAKETVYDEDEGAIVVRLVHHLPTEKSA